MNRKKWMIVIAIIGILLIVFFNKTKSNVNDYNDFDDFDYIVEKGSYFYITTSNPIGNYKIEYYKIDLDKNTVIIEQKEVKNGRTIKKETVKEKKLNEEEKKELINLFNNDDTYIHSEDNYGYYFRVISNDKSGNKNMIVNNKEYVDKFLEIVEMQLTGYSDPYSYDKPIGVE